MKESWPDQLARVRGMASGSETWDLSEKDLGALRALLKRYDALLAVARRVKEYMDKMGLDWLGKGPDPLEAAIAEAEPNVAREE